MCDTRRSEGDVIKEIVHRNVLERKDGPHPVGPLCAWYVEERTHTHSHCW